LAQETNDNNQKINEAVDAYFKANKKEDWFPAKKLMPALIKNGVFTKDKKSGMPLRQLLRSLDKNQELDQIPRVHAERIGVDVYWYFVRKGKKFVSNHVSEEPNAKQKRAIERSNSDEVYVMGLIDTLIGEKGSRKHTFEYLLGDLHKNGETRTKLPIDVYYPNLKLALEIVEIPLDNAESTREEKLTVSGVTRAEQRQIYYNRKKTSLENKDIAFIDIPLERFDVDESSKLLRDAEKDERVLRDLLSGFIR